MCRARNAGIVIPDDLLALPGKLVVREIDVSLDVLAQIVLDGFLILGCRRNDLRVKDRPVLIKLLAMIKNPARRLGASEAGSRFRRDWNRW